MSVFAAVALFAAGGVATVIVEVLLRPRRERRWRRRYEAYVRQELGRHGGIVELRQRRPF